MELVYDFENIAPNYEETLDPDSVALGKALRKYGVEPGLASSITELPYAQAYEHALMALAQHGVHPRQFTEYYPAPEANLPIAS